MQITEVTVSEAIEFLKEEADSLLRVAISYSGDNYVESSHKRAIRGAKALIMAAKALREI